MDFNSDNTSRAAIERATIIDDFYEKVYKDYLYANSIQGRGIQYFGKMVEKFWLRGHLLVGAPKQLEKVLEIGGGSGQHLSFVNQYPVVEYTSLDLRAPDTDEYLHSLDPEFKSVIRFVQGDAERLEFDDESYDRIVITCVLHHVADPLAVLYEARRVLRAGGELSFIMPCDPGILNQLIKKIISYPRLRKLSTVRPELFYAFEHRNHVGSLIEQARHVFSEDLIKFHFRPFWIKNWNANLVVVGHVTKEANKA